MEDIIKLLGGGFLGVIIKELIEYYKIKQTQKFKVSKNLSKVILKKQIELYNYIMDCKLKFESRKITIGKSYENDSKIKESDVYFKFWQECFESDIPHLCI